EDKHHKQRQASKVLNPPGPPSFWARNLQTSLPSPFVIECHIHFPLYYDFWNRSYDHGGYKCKPSFGGCDDPEPNDRGRGVGVCIVRIAQEIRETSSKDCRSPTAFRGNHSWPRSRY